MNAKELRAAIKGIAAADRRDVIEMLTDLELLGELGKAEPNVRHVDDHLRDGRNSTPSREEINTGRPREASGADSHGDGSPAEQSRNVDAATALGQLLERVGTVEKSVTALEANQISQLGLIGKIAEGTRPDLAKAIADLLAKADKPKTDEESEERDEKAKAEAKALAGEHVLSGTVRDIWDALSRRGTAPFAKAAGMLDAIAASLEADEDLSVMERLAGAGALSKCRAVAAGATIPGVARFAIDLLPARAQAHFAALL